ncbi:MAG: serine/threonine protein kinase, partial [Planctomycetes bacterium]|nr:serine/threonine protein kinase [Planctomycetota bacterium]
MMMRSKAMGARERSERLFLKIAVKHRALTEADARRCLERAVALRGRGRQILADAVALGTGLITEQQRSRILEGVRRRLARSMLKGVTPPRGKARPIIRRRTRPEQAVEPVPTPPDTPVTPVSTPAAPTSAHEDPSTHSGKTLGGYKLLERIGRGAMGVVYKARDPRLDRVVALKVLPADLKKDSRLVERFVREAKVVARLNHPNIVHGYDFGQDRGRYYFAMEYIEGSSLAESLRHVGRIDELEACKIALQVARALEYAAQHQVIHRDVKPANILFSTNREVKLSDLGLAKDLGSADMSLTQEGKGVGTPYYIAPEQALGEEVDGRADIYSLGASLYHMVTGRVPFEGSTPAVVMTRHVTQPLPPVREVNPQVSPHVARVIETMLAKRPDDRYRTAAELAQDLESVLRGQTPCIAAGRSVARARRGPSGEHPVVAPRANASAAATVSTAPAAPAAPAAR